jgi:hypothetical protein
MDWLLPYWAAALSSTFTTRRTTLAVARWSGICSDRKALS